MRNACIIFMLVQILLLGSIGADMGGGDQRQGPRRGGGGLALGFYRKTCPLAGQIIREVVWKNAKSNPALPAKLVRMFFHDCFVNGCDGSVLLDSTANSASEKEAIPNRTLAGFEVIEEAKAEVEKACPGVVSCADVLALATRDSVSFQLKRKAWDVETGRRDGFISLASNTAGNLPGPNQNFSSLLRIFESKNLSLKDLVVLSGGHTIGVGHCSIINRRLYNFTGKGDADPALDPAYAAVLRSQCAPGDAVATVGMDPGSSDAFDNRYFAAVKQGKGFFTSDAALLTDWRSKRIVDEMLEPFEFLPEFGLSMNKMGAIEVLTGSAGEIRRTCAVVNS